ncbi:MAG: hypothetical protein ABII82_16655 [Verrucomicrobiota bacterium]
MIAPTPSAPLPATPATPAAPHPTTAPDHATGGQPFDRVLHDCTAQRPSPDRTTPDQTGQFVSKNQRQTSSVGETGAPPSPVTTPVAPAPDATTARATQSPALPPRPDFANAEASHFMIADANGTPPAGATIRGDATPQPRPSPARTPASHGEPRRPLNASAEADPAPTLLAGPATPAPATPSEPTAINDHHPAATRTDESPSGDIPAAPAPARTKTGRGTPADEPSPELAAMFGLSSRLFPTEAPARPPTADGDAWSRTARPDTGDAAPAFNARTSGQNVSIFIGQAAAPTSPAPKPDQLASTAAPTANAPAAPATTPAPATAVPEAAGLPVATEAVPARDPATLRAPIPANGFNSAVQAANGIPANPGAQSAGSAEKIAATATPPSAQPSFPVRNDAKNIFLNTDSKQDTSIEKPAGIVNAKTPADMSSVFENQAQATGSRDAATGLAPAPATVSAVFSPATGGLEKAGEPAPGESAVAAANPAEAVRRVVDIVHEFRGRDRGSVEVAFDFAGEEALTVRVDLRGGEVRTTFRTDSDELRAALGREWRGFAADFAHEARGQRVADPVFTGADGSRQSGADAGASGGRDARQSFANPDQPGSHRGAPSDGARHSHAASAPAQPAAAPRVSTHRLLQAFA